MLSMNQTILRVIFLFILVMGDFYLLKNEYAKKNRLPFVLPGIIQEKIATVLPTPIVVRPSLESLVEFSDGKWIGSIVYGKITNHASVTLIDPVLFFSLSATKEENSYLDSFLATISAKINPGESVYFSQRFQTPVTESFWWSAVISHVASDSGQPVSKISKNQRVSTKPILAPIVAPKATADPGPWGVAKQITDVTWTIKLGTDDRMATPQETLQALNSYRSAHSSPPLTWDDNLATFASSRAKHLNSIQSTDEHKGFKDYVNNEENVKRLGFWALGENSGYGSKLIGVHLIEWVYASDPAHNANQLDKQWSHVGIGIEGLGVVFIFGGSKI